MDGLDRIPDAFGHHQRFVQLGIGQDDAKLLAAIAGHMVIGTRLAFDRQCDEHQGLIARHMAKGIVVGFEMVRIHHQQAQRRFGAQGARKLMGQQGIKSAAVLQSRQWIRQGLLLQVMVKLFNAALLVLQLLVAQGLCFGHKLQLGIHAAQRQQLHHLAGEGLQGL